MLTSDVSSEYSCVKMSQAPGPTSKVYERYRRIYIVFPKLKRVDFCHVNSEFMR